MSRAYLSYTPLTTKRDQGDKCVMRSLAHIQQASELKKLLAFYSSLRTGQPESFSESRRAWRNWRHPIAYSKPTVLSD
jgi:hypothetical protein